MSSEEYEKKRGRLFIITAVLAVMIVIYIHLFGLRISLQSNEQQTYVAIIVGLVAAVIYSYVIISKEKN
jgi:uncharacterized membrane protein